MVAALLLAVGGLCVLGGAEAARADDWTQDAAGGMDGTYRRRAAMAPSMAMCGSDLFVGTGGEYPYGGGCSVWRYDGSSWTLAGEDGMGDPDNSIVWALQTYDTRLYAGTLETGRVRPGDEIIFYPSGKKSRVRTLEVFNRPAPDAFQAGQTAGLTLDTQVYVRPGELIARAGEPAPHVATRLRCNLFWVGQTPMIRGKSYKLKLGAARAQVRLAEILLVLDASDLTTETNKQVVERHDVAECILEASKPLAFDLASRIEATGRFVIVDNYEIAAAGIILEALDDQRSILQDHVRAREMSWQPSAIPPERRRAAFGHGAKFVVITGEAADQVGALACTLERVLFEAGFKAYGLDAGNIRQGLDADLAGDRFDAWDEQVRRLGELARILTDSGQIFITALPGADDHDIKTLELLNSPNEILVVRIGDENRPDRRRADLSLVAEDSPEQAVEKIKALLRTHHVITDYSI